MHKKMFAAFFAAAVLALALPLGAAADEVDVKAADETAQTVTKETNDRPDKTDEKKHEEKEPEKIIKHKVQKIIGTEKGDLNADGAIDSNDALITLQISIHPDWFEGYEYVADVNSDNVVDSSDAIDILRLTVFQFVDFGSTMKQENYYWLDAPLDGVDVSYWQEDINFDHLKEAGYDFAILRAGTGTNYRDTRFEENYWKAKAAGMGVGVYWYSYAATEEQAIEEAELCLEMIDGKQLDYPVYFDLENHWQVDTGEWFCSMLVSAFGNTIRDAGYVPGFYMSSWYAEHNLSDFCKENYEPWVAQWDPELSFTSPCPMWQYGVGYAWGVDGQVDLDYCYFNYPEYVYDRRINGWQFVD